MFFGPYTIFFLIAFGIVAIPAAVFFSIGLIHFADSCEQGLPEASGKATLTCFHCGQETSARGKTCQHCGGELQ